MNTKSTLLIMVTTIVLALTTCITMPSSNNEEIARSNVFISMPQCTQDDLIQEEVDDAYLLESPSRKDAIVNDIVQIWTMFFNDDGAPQYDPRRQNFNEYAGYLADAILLYESQPTDLGGQLPKNEDVHILLATMVTQESSVTPDVVGSRGEVGLLQVHGTALAGYDAEEVRFSPNLGLLLGVRWFVYQKTQCKQTVDSNSMTLDEWKWPLSVYAGGMNAINRDTGRCKAFDIAVKRVKLAKLYKTRITAFSLD